MSESSRRTCPYCGKGFRPRKGGKAQSYCSTTCKNNHRAARVAYAEEAESAGDTSIAAERAALARKLAARSPGPKLTQTSGAV